MTSHPPTQSVLMIDVDDILNVWLKPLVDGWNPHMKKHGENESNAQSI